MLELETEQLLSTGTIQVRHVRCSGTCRHRGPEECSDITHLVFPYSGAYVRHVGHQQFIADANHVLFFNAKETYQVSHPVRGGDRNFVIQPSEEALCELAPPGMLTYSGALRFQRQHQRIDPRAQSLVAL